MLTSVVTGLAMLATLASAQPVPGPGDSFARCSFQGRGLAGSVSQEVGVEIVALASEYVCGDVTVATRTARATATRIANATAVALAGAAASCYSTGQASFRINGMSAANAEASAIASSVIAAAVGVEVCGECEVAAALFARSYEAIYIEATATAELALNGSTLPGETLEVRAEAFQLQIVTASVPAIADVLLTIAGAVGEGCNATILADVGSDLNGVSCSVNVSGIAESAMSTSTSIALRAGVQIAQKACGVEIESEFSLLVTQVARAMAAAIAEISASCLIAGDAYACVLGDAEINATANATATAFALAFSEETETCGNDICTLRVEALIRVCRTVLIQATSALYLEQCAGPDSFFSINALQETLVNITVGPLLEIVDEITVIEGRCSVTVPVFTVPEPPMMMMPMSNMTMMNATVPTCGDTCSANNRKCFGSDFDVPNACCGADYICVRRDEDFSQCRLNGVPGTFVEWDGREEVCTPAM